MSLLTKVARSVPTLLGPLADEVGPTVPVVQRRRKFTPATLAQTFLRGFLAKPRAADEELARTAALCGVSVTTPAVEPRFTDTLATFLETLFGRAVCHQVPADSALAPLVERFPAVILQDSTTITPPDAWRERFPGGGGSYGGGQAAMKLQVPLDLRSGALSAVSVEAGKDCDQRTPLQSAPLPERSLRITDLGYLVVSGQSKHPLVE
jgi:hypothetical protein